MEREAGKGESGRGGAIAEVSGISADPVREIFSSNGRTLFSELPIAKWGLRSRTRKRALQRGRNM